MKRTIFMLLLAFMAVAKSAKADEAKELGVFKTKEDYINQKLTWIGVIQKSDNYNVGELNVQLKDRAVIIINCIRERYFGFKYIDGNDYVQVDGVYARAVITGNVNLLISPKADFKVDDNGKYTFTPSPNGALSYYFERDLGKKSSSKFERAIADDKDLLQKYKNDKENYGDIINKEIKYALLFNDKPQKDNKKVKTVAKKKSSSKKHKR